MSPPATLLLRLLVCLTAAWWAYGVWGARVLPWCAVLFGVALARPLLETLGEVPQLARWLAFRGVHGQHYAFHGRRIRVHEDAAGHRWVELSAVRHFHPFLPNDRRLAQAFPDAFEPAGSGHGARLRVTELLTLLAHSARPEAIRLRNWLAREVAFPAEQRRRQRESERTAQAGVNRSARAPGQ